MGRTEVRVTLMDSAATDLPAKPRREGGSQGRAAPDPRRGLTAALAVPQSR